MLNILHVKGKSAQVIEVHNSIDSRNVLLKRPRLLIIYDKSLSQNFA